MDTLPEDLVAVSLRLFAAERGGLVCKKSLRELWRMYKALVSWTDWPAHRVLVAGRFPTTLLVREAVAKAAAERGLSLRGESLGNMPAVFQDDRAVVLAALKQNVKALWHASPALRDDKAVVLAAVKECGGVLAFTPPALRDDKAVVLELLHALVVRRAGPPEPTCGRQISPRRAWRSPWRSGRRSRPDVRYRTGYTHRSTHRRRGTREDGKSLR